MASEIFGAGEVDWHESWPQVVVGAGGCGMVAALAAARQGGRVLLLEKAAELSGNTTLSTGLIPAAGTRFQREVGVLDDTPELMVRDILEKNHHESDPILTRKLCDTSAELIEWLVDEIGCELICYTDFLYPGQRRFRMHGPPRGYGAALVRQLERAIEKDSHIELRMGTAARGLVWDDERVVGVMTNAGAIEAGAVVLALNGFAGNAQMVLEYLGPEAASALYYGSPNNTGEGICWGAALGGEVAHMGSYQGHASVAEPEGPLVTWGLVTNGAILVNRRGQRFGCESQGYSEFTRAVLAQPGDEAWEIFDQAVYDASRGTRFEEVIEAGKVVRSETLEELAAVLGLPSDELRSSVESTNRAASGEALDPFGRIDFANGLLEPPFCGVRVCGALFHTQGGLKVDPDARVLGSDSTPIPGLYAGGGTAAGISGNGSEGYLAGNGLLTALGLGKIAGETATSDARAGVR